MSLHLTVRARMGQTVDDLERAVPRSAMLAGAHSARSVVISPGTLSIELVMRELLSTVGNATPPTAVATTRVTLGRCENGSAWTLPLSGRHTLTVGLLRCRQGSVFWGIAGGLVPPLPPAWFGSWNRSECTHRIVGRLRSVTKIATTEPMPWTLAALEKLMNEAALRWSAVTRPSTLPPGPPSHGVADRRTGGMTAYMTTPHA